MQEILNRLKEPSTYAGLSILATVFGINAEEFVVWSNAIAGVFAVVAVVVSEKKS